MVVDLLPILKREIERRERRGFDSSRRHVVNLLL
jgi:hypothetical protein